MDAIPWKTVYLGTQPIGASEWQPGDTLPVAYGGTGVSSYAELLTQLGLENYQDIKHNFAATAAPTQTNDSAEGYTRGSRWLDTSTNTFYLCSDASAGAALWQGESIADQDAMLAGASSNQVTAVELRAHLDAPVASFISNNELAYVDSVRGKILSASLQQTSFGRKRSNTSNQYLRGVDGIASNLGGFGLLYDMTLVGLVAVGRDDNETWTAEVRSNDSTTSLASLQVVDSKIAADATLNVDFDLGDRIQIYLAGSGISYPTVTAFFRRRHA